MQVEIAQSQTRAAHHGERAFFGVECPHGAEAAFPRDLLYRLDVSVCVSTCGERKEEMGEGGGCCFTHPPPSWVSTQIVPTCGLFHKGHAKGTFLPPPPFFGDQLQKPVPVSFKWTTVTVAPD